MSKGQRFFEAYAKAVGLWVEQDKWDHYIPRAWADLTPKEQAACALAAEFYEQAQ